MLSSCFVCVFDVCGDVVSMRFCVIDVFLMCFLMCVFICFLCVSDVYFDVFLKCLWRDFDMLLTCCRIIFEVFLMCFMCFVF